MSKRKPYVRDPERERLYRAFMASGIWKAIRGAAIHRAGNACEWCKCSGDDFLLHVHHKTYDRFGGREESQDLQVLCDGCHAEAHGRPYLLCKTTKKEQAERRKRAKANKPKTQAELAKEAKRARKRAHWARIRAKQKENAENLAGWVGVSIKDRY